MSRYFADANGTEMSDAYGELLDMAKEQRRGWTPKQRANDFLLRISSADHAPAYVNMMAEMIAEAVEAERERCCQIVYGQCGSDNVAERTVRAIRKNEK